MKGIGYCAFFLVLPGISGSLNAGVGQGSVGLLIPAQANMEQAPGSFKLDRDYPVQFDGSELGAYPQPLSSRLIMVIQISRHINLFCTFECPDSPCTTVQWNCPALNHEHQRITRPLAHRGWRLLGRRP